MSIPDGTGHASAANDNERHTQLTRRGAVVALLQCGIFAHAFGCHQLAAGPFQTESQPLLAAVGRLVDAMAFLGEPFSEADKARLLAAGSQKTADEAVAEIERVLDPHCLVSVRINPESRVSVERGAAPARLVEQGWRAFLMKVRNEAGVTGVLNAESPQARPVYRPGTGSPLAPNRSCRPTSPTAGCVITNHGAKPMEPQLSGLLLEYRIVLLYSRDRGRREAQIGATLAPGRPISDSATGPRSSSTSRRRATSRCASATRMAGRLRRRSSCRTRSAGSIRRVRSGSRRISSFRTRSTAPTARPCACRMASSR